MRAKAKRSLALFLCLFLAASMGAAVLSVAFADDGYVVDEDDSPGPLDIARFGFFQESPGGHLTVDLYENLDPSLLDQEHNWIGFILEDDIVKDGYVNAVFVKYAEQGLEAGLYGPGRGGPDSQRFIENVDVQMTDENTLDVFLTPRQYAAFHHWYAQTSFETIGQDDRGYTECNWDAPPPRPTPAVGKCLDETSSIYPTVDESPSPTVTSTPSDPPCAFRQSQCQRNYITIHRGDRGFYGVVKHRNEVCEARKVVLRRARDGKVMGRDVTGDGRWRIGLERAPASYYAVAKRAVYGTSDGDLVCRWERSLTIQG